MNILIDTFQNEIVAQRMYNTDLVRANEQLQETVEMMGKELEKNQVRHKNNHGCIENTYCHLFMRVG